MTNEELHNLRVYNQQKTYESWDYQFEIIRAKYELWSNYIKHINPMKTSSFKLFLQDELGNEYNKFYIKKRFAEKYFGIKYKYDYDKQKWCIDKN